MERALNDIPVIDVHSTVKTEGWDGLAAQLLQVYSSIGFCYLVNHGVSEDARTGIFRANVDFHSLPHEKKMAMELNHFHRGFIPINTSTLVTSHVDSVKRPNQSESVIILHEASEASKAQGLPLAGDNQWPDDLPRFREQVDAYRREVSSLARLLVRAFAVALGVPQAYFDSFFEEPTTFTRLFRYPPHPLDAPEDLFGSAPHTDYGFMTLVMQDDVGGLQVRHNSKWIDVVPLPGSFVLNVGDTLHKWSNGKLLATPHRVINKGQDRFRYSVAFFFDPNITTKVSPIVVDGETSRFEEFYYCDYLLSRINRNHTQRQAAPISK